MSRTVTRLETLAGLAAAGLLDSPAEWLELAGLALTKAALAAKRDRDLPSAYRRNLDKNLSRLEETIEDIRESLAYYKSRKEETA